MEPPRAAGAVPGPNGVEFEPLPEGVVRSLSRPSAYPDDPTAVQGIEIVETHLSTVFLTPERVYKLRKAVDLGFVSFVARAERNADCLREIRLNRRLAPDVYLGVAPLQERDGALQVGPIADDLASPDASGEMPEHCVVMRRLPDGRDALTLLERGALRTRHIVAVAELVARFHEQHRLEAPAPFSSENWLRRITEPASENFAALATVAGRIVPCATLRRAAERTRTFVEAHAARFEERRAAGRAIDGHGDLHLQHVWFEHDAAEPLLIDCAEFRDDFRRIDAAADIAFLAMDLAYRRRPRWAERLLAVYALEADDFDLYHVVDYFTSYRAAVRAKVAAMVAEDAGLGATRRAAAAGSARRHLALSARALEDRGRGGLVLLCGMVGTGKSTLARIVAQELGGALVSSDRLRKRQAGLAPTTRTGSEWGKGLYTPERTRQVYAGLLSRAAPIIASGRVAVLDATFAMKALRAPVLRWARERGVAAFLLETRCAAPEALARLAQREAKRRHVSDAGRAEYLRGARGFQPPADWPESRRSSVHTDSPAWKREARALARRLRAHLRS